MRSETLFRELTAVGLVAASYPLGWLAERADELIGHSLAEPLIFLHGLGGSGSNLAGPAMYLRMAGFDNRMEYFEYSPRQSISASVDQLAETIDAMDTARGVHLIGHSLGGTIARRYAFHARAGLVRSLITLGSPYSCDQHSPAELAIFGEEDPIVPPPRLESMRPGAVKRIITLPSTGHIGLLYHPDALRAIETELRANSGPT